mmetsp:Transcript_32301/g.78229  ORF Transcript_32301/g.78229 Transcript_32301/m.78229 type:complete len:85 (-) Transcript_32301:1453-1707(-)
MHDASALSMEDFNESFKSMDMEERSKSSGSNNRNTDGHHHNGGHRQQQQRQRLPDLDGSVGGGGRSALTYRPPIAGGLIPAGVG